MWPAFTAMLGDILTMKIAYNHEMLICFTSQTPYQPYSEEVGIRQIRSHIRELGGTGVDLLMCCPTAWRLPLYYSDVNPVWQDWGRNWKAPNVVDDWKYFDKVFHRVREYMLSEDYEDPVAATLQEARKQGITPGLSYRMNDNHYTHFNKERIAPTMDPFWREHPELRLSSNAMNYFFPEVREWYYAILEELVQRYDATLLELDFMRNPKYFEPEQVTEGIGIMTDFVRRIRQLTDDNGLQLAVRVPRSLEAATQAGLDVAQWKKENLVDLITVSTFYITSPEQDIEDFKALPGKAELLGELHFITRTLPLLGHDVSRRTGREIYRTLAASLTERGADGVSFFNFAYVRDHHFCEPRQRPFMNVEPPFEIFAQIKDPRYLATIPLHYVISTGSIFPFMPDGKPLDLKMHLPSAAKSGKSAFLRVETDKPGLLFNSLTAEINGAALKQIPGSGELFPPISNFALPDPMCLFYFEVDPGIIRQAWNDIRILVRTDGEFAIANCDISLVGVELAVRQF
jgi:hypothetical protein